MGKEEYTQKFLEEQLKLWKNKISKRKKWVENVKEYKNTIKNTQKYLNKLEESLKDISFGEQYQEMKNLSKQHSTNFLDYLNDENIKEFLNIDYFQKIENSYKEKYWGKQIIKKIKKDLINTELNKDTIVNLESGKGSLILYILIEHLNKLHQNNIRNNLIEFYNSAIELFRLPHSASSRRGLHFEVCNNNFIEDIKDFFENAKNVNYYNTLNGTYPYRSKKQDTFNLYENENVALELFGWINLAKQKNNNFVAIYNNKVIDNLKILMGTDKKLDDLDDFYNVYTQYLKQLYDNNKDTYSKEELLYADQFFQYIHELNIKQSHKNIIYYGAPGTGKTYSVLETIKMLTDEEKQYYKMVQFHPSYSYEDFIEGIKPSGIDDNGNLRFGLVNGEFKKFCIKANQDREHNYYFIIDEINRAELSRVFGEILFCLEYRLKDNDKRGLIRTPYANLLDENVLRVVLVVVILVAGLLMVKQPKSFRGFKGGRFTWERRFKDEVYTVNVPLVGLMTGLVGFFVGMVGVTGGVFKVPIMVLLCGVPMDIAVGTSSGMVFLTAIFGLTGHLMTANKINWLVMMLISVACLVGGMLGAKISLKVDRKKLRLSYGFLMFMLAILTILKRLFLPI